MLNITDETEGYNRKLNESIVNQIQKNKKEDIWSKIAENFEEQQPCLEL